MSDYEMDDDGHYVVIERSEPGIGSFILGLAVGAGIALLFAPRTGEETRRDLQRRAKRVGDQAQDFVSEMTDSVSQTINAAKEKVEEPDRFDASGGGAQEAPGLERSRCRSRGGAAGASRARAAHRRNEGRV